MKPRDLVVPALLTVPFILSLIQRASALPTDATLFLHIKHSPPYPSTIGKVQQIYSEILKANKTGLNIGLQPQCTADWTTEKAYYQECGSVPVMLTVMSSDNGYMLDIPRIEEILSLCNVKWLRFHETLSYYNPFPTDYALSILQFAKNHNLPVFWNEWNVYTFPQLTTIIQGYEDAVAVSFGTNNGQIEPIDGFAELQQFRRRAASVQSWYWWERNGRQEGYQYTMPPDLMRLHTQQAFQAGCEIVQYEPFSYFFDVSNPKITLSGVLGAKI